MTVILSAIWAVCGSVSRKDFARHLRRHRSQLAAIFDRGIGLGIERFLMGDAARQEDMDHALGFGLDEVVVLLRPLRLLHAEIVAQRQTDAGQGTDRQKSATIRS